MEFGAAGSPITGVGLFGSLTGARKSCGQSLPELMPMKLTYTERKRRLSLPVLAPILREKR